MNVTNRLKAYTAGVFPWPHNGLPLLWFFPDPRFVLIPKDLRITRSLKKAIKSSKLVVECDKDFNSVISQFRKAKRKDQPGTWITDNLIDAYVDLHKNIHAHSGF